MKSRIIKFALSLCLTLGVMFFSNALVKDDNAQAVKADELVGTPEVSWNNVDFTSGHVWASPTNDLGVPQQGYCLLALYPSDISIAAHTENNLVNDDLTGCNVGDYILINGSKSKDLEGVVVYCYPTNGLFIYVPHSSVTFSEQYEYLTVVILEGMSIDGSIQTVGTRFEYRGLLGSHGKWEINPDPIEKVNAEFTSINWNNRDFTYGEWTGDLTVLGTPVNGYCMLAFFNEKGKSYKDSAIGDIINSGRGAIGIGANADYKIKVNGVNIIDVEDALCYIYPQYGLFFYIPDASLSHKDQYLYPTITFESGLRFNHVVLPVMSFEFRGKIGEQDCWVALKDSSSYNKFTYYGIAGGWNNIPLDATHKQTILQVGAFEEDYLKNDKTADATNLVGRFSDCGTKISINGLPLWQCGDPVVSYAHGYCYIYIALPIQALQPSNGYDVVTFHVEKGTIFHDTMLDEITLYLFNGEWVSTKPETPVESDYTNALTFSQTFGVEQVTLNADKQTLSSTKECSLNNFGLMLDYKLASSDSSFVLYVMGKNKQDGLRIVFLGNTVSLYDATQENVLLGSVEISEFVEDDWYSLFLSTKVTDNKLSICVSIDGITYIHTKNVALTNKDNIGNSFNVYLGAGSISLKNTKLGSDNKKPIIAYSGKAVYGVAPGSKAIDFSNKCTAIDLIDGNVSKFITVTWQEGALTNNIINEGVWEVSIVASDASKNESKVVVTVVAKDNLKVTVTFDGENPTTYQVGDHIASVADPVKEGQRFIGWYYNNKLWDFENDYVITDMDLISKYQETTKEYCISFTIEGLKDTTPYSLYFKYGATLDLQLFAKNGYSLKVYVDDVEVESIIVTKDMSVKLVYTANKKKGCMGSVSSSVALLSIFSGIAFGLLVFLKKKGGKEYE